MGSFAVVDVVCIAEVEDVVEDRHRNWLHKGCGLAAGMQGFDGDFLCM